MYHCLSMRRLLLIAVVVQVLIESTAATFEDTCYRPTTITFLAVNTSNGTALKYKISSSDTTGTILFEDAYLPSPSACGDDSQRCQNLTVITHEDVIVVAIPLRKNFGIATFENNGSFREKRLFNFTQECELVSIFPHALQRNMLPLQGVCLHGNQNGFLLNQIYISINATHLTESLGTQRERGTRQLPMCQVVNPSAFIYSNSPAISSSLGATIFVDVRTVFVQITNQRCDPQNDPMECSVLQRFVSITPNVHAIYCNMQTYLFRLDRNSLMEFAKSVEGLPFFCSSTMYYAFKEGNLTLHHVGNRSASGVAVPFYFQNITRGDCAVLNHSQIVLVQLSDGTVVSMNFSHPHNTLGFSSSPPRRFDRFVLLSNATHALVYDLLSGGLVDTLEESSPFMGYVLGISSEAVPCFVTPTTSSRPPKETTTPAVIGVSAAVRLGLGLGLGLGLITVLIIVIVVVIIGIKIHTKRRNNQPQRFILPETGDQKEPEIRPTEETNPSRRGHLISGGVANPLPADPLPPPVNPPPADPPRNNNRMNQNNHVNHNNNQ